MKQLHVSHKGFIIGALIVAVIIFIALGLDQRLKVVHYRIDSPKVLKPFKIVVISDLHGCKYGDKQSELIEQIKAQAPDILVYPGDIYDDKMPHGPSQQLLEQLEGLYPSYYVSGNHEFWSYQAETIKQAIRETGVNVLEGDTVPLTINGQTISISGIDDPFVSQYTPQKGSFNDQLARCFSQVDPADYNIVLSHRPERVARILAGDVDLVLAGHAHGGQWRIPGILNGLYAPDQGLFPKYAGGRYDFNDKSMIVSRGLARESTRIPRFHNRPELVVVEVY